MAEVAREADDLHARVALGGGGHRVAGAVLGTVVDEDQLVVEVAEGSLDPRRERVDRVLFLVHRRHHAEQPHLAVHGRQGTGGIRCAAMADDGAVERELFEVGRKLAAALPTTRNPLKALDDKAMDLASSDAELKAALFRFVDVVPACRNLDDLARHLTAFLEDVGEPPPPVGVALKMGNSQGRPARAGHGRGVRGQTHGAPLHRRRGPEGRARRPARPVEGRRRVLGRPARRGDGHAGRGAALRRPLRRRARHDRARPRPAGRSARSSSATRRARCRGRTCRSRSAR